MQNPENGQTRTEELATPAVSAQPGLKDFSVKHASDLSKKFESYFHEIEAFGLRSERFMASLDSFSSKEALAESMKAWMEAAFVEGAKAMAQDILDTLLDYGTATSGLTEPQRNPTECYDAAHAALLHYLTNELGLVKSEKTKV